MADVLAAPEHAVAGPGARGQVKRRGAGFPFFGRLALQGGAGQADPQLY